MPYKKTIKSERDATFQYTQDGDRKIRGESFLGNEVFFDNINDAIKSIGCTKKELTDAIRRNEKTRDGTWEEQSYAKISYRDPDSDDCSMSYWWSYVDE